MKFFVYILIDPKTHKVFYVGCTKNIVARKLGHTVEMCSRQIIPTRKDNYIIKMGVDPILVVVDEVSLIKELPKSEVPVSARRLEQQWIEKFLKLGCDLTNQRWFNKNRKNIIFQ